MSILLFILGLVFGSFITALSYRYPRGISNAKGRSFCDNCKHQINWYDNIPLFSYLILGGKCRYCKKHISIRYPLIELVTGIGFVLLTLQGLTLQGICNIIIFCLLELIFIIDLENQIIPDSFIYIGIFVVIFISQFTIFNEFSIFNSLFAGFICASFLLLINLFTKGRGMGLGDVKFAVLGGMIVGLTLSPVWLFVAFLTGAILGIILILDKKAGLKTKIAFGPFLVLSIPITLIFGQTILKFIGLQ